MVNRATNEDYLLAAEFENGTALYTRDFKIEIVGTLWPREMRAFSEMVKLYTVESKLSIAAAIKAKEKT